MDSFNLLDQVSVLSSSTSASESSALPHETESQFNLFNEESLQGFIGDLLKNHSPRKSKLSLYEWCLHKTDIMDEKSRTFIEDNKTAISQFRNKRQLIGFFKVKIPRNGSVTGRANGVGAITDVGAVSKWNNLIWFLLGVLTAVLGVSLIGMLSLNRAVKIIEWNKLDRQYLGYYKSIKSILDSIHNDL